MVEKKRNLPSVEKKTLKRNKLEYAYQIDESFRSYPLLGSIVRALGKGWDVVVITDENHVHPFFRLKNSLVDLEILQVYTSAPEKIANDTALLILDLHNSELISSLRNRHDVFGQMHVMTTDSSPDDRYDLISKFTISNFGDSNIVAITGTGKGKTTTSLGLAVEEVAKGKKAAIIQWFKEKKSGKLTWTISEHNFPELLKNSSLMQIEATGLGFFGSPKMDRVTEYEAHRKNAYDGLKKAREMLKGKQYDILVLDEFIDTVPEISQNIVMPLIDLEDVRKFLQECALQNRTRVIVTGRKLTSHWSEFIGTSIEVEEVRHPWATKKSGAISGLDF